MFVEKRAEKRKKKKEEGSYDFWDLFVDSLIWVPELILLPFRLVFLMVRMFIRVMSDS